MQVPSRAAVAMAGSGRYAAFEAVEPNGQF